MRILVLGGSSSIGAEIVYLLKTEHVISYTFNKNHLKLNDCRAFKLDVSDRETVLDIIKEVAPQLVIHTASATNVDKCETDREMAYRINVEGTKHVIDGCLESTAKIVYMSTAFVFDGSKPIFYENDVTNPINNYGKTKLSAENLIMKSGLPFLIIRTDQLYGWCKKGQKENEVIKALKNIREGKPFETIIDWYNTPTLVYNAAEVIKSLIDNEKQGIYHVVGSDYVSRYEWLLKMADVFGFGRDLIKCNKSGNLNLPAKRPNARLSNEKAENETGIELFGIEEGLKFMFNNASL